MVGESMEFTCPDCERTIVAVDELSETPLDELSIIFLCPDCDEILSVDCESVSEKRRRDMYLKNLGYTFFEEMDERRKKKADSAETTTSQD